MDKTIPSESNSINLGVKIKSSGKISTNSNGGSQKSLLNLNYTNSTNSFKIKSGNTPKRSSKKVINPDGVDQKATVKPIPFFPNFGSSKITENPLFDKQAAGLSPDEKLSSDLSQEQYSRERSEIILKRLSNQSPESIPNKLKSNKTIGATNSIFEHKMGTDMTKKYLEEVSLRKKIEEKYKSLKIIKRNLQTALNFANSEVLNFKSVHEATLEKLQSQVDALKDENRRLRKKIEGFNQQVKKNDLKEKEQSENFKEKKEQSDNSKETQGVNSKILSMADELFEKNSEIKALRSQKQELFKELESVKTLNFELSELKQQVYYLLNTIHRLKDHMVKTVENFKHHEGSNGMEKDILQSMTKITESLNHTIEHSMKKKQTDFTKIVSSWSTGEFKFAMEAWLVDNLRDKLLHK